MAIRYECTCGANIRLPVSAAGKKARCQSCKAVFTVPEPGYDPDDRPIPLEGGGTEPPHPSADQPPVGGWLADFAREEKRTNGASPVVVQQIPSKSLTAESELQEAEQEAARTALPRVTPRLPHEEAKAYDADRAGVVGPELPFWHDLLQSFVFFLEPANLVTFVILGVAMFVPICIPMAGPFAYLVVSLYISAFYMAIVRDTAAGEDRLPEVIWMSSPLDLLLPLFHFLGVTALAMVPAMIYILFSFKGNGLGEFLVHAMRAPDMPVVRGLAAMGILFWPAMTLAVAIGGSFRGFWPHRIILMAVNAPVAYAAVCGILLIAAVLWYLPSSPPVASMTNDLVQQFGLRVLIGMRLVSAFIGLYAMIVAMRTIGLFYRHFKHRFPWVAE